MFKHNLFKSPDKFFPFPGNKDIITVPDNIQIYTLSIPDTFFFPDKDILNGFLYGKGVIPCFSLYSICICLRLSVSSIASSMAGDILSAYIKTFPFTFLAALPIVWMRM